MNWKNLLVIGAAALLGSVSSVFAASNVQDPSGKTVLVIDGDNIKPDAAGKAVLTIDGDNIKDADGKLVMFINGDFTRTEPNGKVLLYVDGRNILREPGGTKLLYNDAKDLMRGDRTGKPLLHFDGDLPSRQQLMAVIYVLMPDLVKGAKEGDAAIVADQGKAGAAGDAQTLKDFPPGNYKITGYRATDASNYTGTVAIAKVGDVLVMDFKFDKGDPMQAVAIQHGDEIWAAMGTPATVGLAVYGVKGGQLTGTWYNATGKPESFGTENATGAEKLGGDYKITDAKAPFTQAAYTGTLSLNDTGKHLQKDVSAFDASWDFAGTKVKGAAFGTADNLVIATSAGATDFSVALFKVDVKQATLTGTSYSGSKVAAQWFLGKSK